MTEGGGRRLSLRPSPCVRRRGRYMDEELDAQEISSERYHIDPSWYEPHGRSLQAFMASRMCASCQEKLGTPIEERVATVDKTGKVIFERQMVPYGSNPFK